MASNLVRSGPRVLLSRATTTTRPTLLPIAATTILTILTSLQPTRPLSTLPRTPSSRQTQARPRLPPSSRIPTHRTLFIETAGTPNIDALKFIPNTRIIPESIQKPSIEYLTPRSTISPPYPSPLASKLLAVEGVKGVFLGSDFLTVTKMTDVAWEHVKPEVFSLITEAVTSGEAIVTVSRGGEAGTTTAGDAGEGQQGEEEGEIDSLAYDENDTEVVGMVKELLDTRVRPTIMADGGDIEFCGMDDDGIVHLKLRGACRTCDSSTTTMKMGIENMLIHYVSEVKGVEQVMDEADDASEIEFRKFEERLRAQRGERFNKMEEETKGEKRGPPAQQSQGIGYEKMY